MKKLSVITLRKQTTRDSKPYVFSRILIFNEFSIAKVGKVVSLLQ